MTKTIVVDYDNIRAAQLVIELLGSVDKAEPHIIAIARARPGDSIEVPLKLWEQPV